MSVWALVLAGLINGQPVAQIESGFETKAACEKGKLEEEATLHKNIRPEVVAIGVGCIEIKPAPGKPV
jgi:hypothetical protein